MGYFDNTARAGFVLAPLCVVLILISLYFRLMETH